jgi:HK97 family phage prohead protease
MTNLTHLKPVEVTVADSDSLATGQTADEVRDEELELRKYRTEMLEGTREVRHFAASGLEVRNTSDGGMRFSGYASVTEQPYDVGKFVETIARGAFRRTLNESPDVVLVVNHGEGGQLPLARTKSGTMTLSEDARGLRVDADLNPDDPDVRALIPKLQRGDVDEMSFAFRVTDQTWSDDRTQRLIRSVALHKGDVSIVTHGANDASTGGLAGALRSLADDREERGGKTLSAKTRSDLEEIKTAIGELLDSNDAPAAKPPPDLQPEGERASEPDEVVAEPVAEPEPVAPTSPQRIKSLLDYTTGARAWLDQMQEVR